MSEGQGFDPGWNDPPTFSYAKANEIQANAVRKGTVLNKRVPFPLSGSPVASGTTSGQDPTLPPLPIDPCSRISLPPKCFPPSLPKTPAPEHNAQNFSSRTSFDVVMENLKNVHSFEENDEITKRIKIMENMWNEGKLVAIERQLISLSSAIGDGDVSKADLEQKSLMVDHVSLCSTWMGGIRQLINKLRTDSS